MKRIIIITAALFFLIVSARSIDAQSQNATITINASNLNGKINSLLLGQGLHFAQQPTVNQGYYSDIEKKMLNPAFFSPLKALSPSILRIGGAQDTEWYHWTDGIGPISSRPDKFQLSNANKDSHFVNFLGTDEMMQLAEKINAATIMTVNITDGSNWNPSADPDGTLQEAGTPQEAAAWVAYVNGTNENDSRVIGKDEKNKDWGTVGGWVKKRIANGHVPPYNAKYWEISNEAYLRINGTKYAEIFIQFAQAMKAVDPSIQIGAVVVNDSFGGDWNTALMNRLKSSSFKPEFWVVHQYTGGDPRRIICYPNDPCTWKINVNFTNNPVNNEYLVKIKALIPYETRTANTQTITVSVDTTTKKYLISNIFQGYEEREYSIGIPASDVSSGTHTLTVHADSILEINRLFSVNGQQYELETEKNLFGLTMRGTQDLSNQLNGIRQLAAAKGLTDKLAVTEYNIWYAVSTHGADLNAGLSIASVLDMYARRNDMLLSTLYLFADWVGGDQWGAIGRWDWNTFWPNPQFYAMQLFHMLVGAGDGNTLVNTTVTAPSSADNYTLLTALSTKDISNGKLYLYVINKSYDSAFSTQLNITGMQQIQPTAFTWTLNADSISATNEVEDFMKNVRIRPGTITNATSNFFYTFPAHSLTLIALQEKPNQTSAIIIRAKATSSTNIWPRMYLWVDGQPAAEWNVNSLVYQDYMAVVPKIANGQEIEIVYTNDGNHPISGQDRDLFVDWFTLDGQKVQAEDPLVTYDEGAVYAAIDGSQTAPGKEDIRENGALRYKVSLCPRKPLGDFNCDDKISLADFNEWRNQFKGVPPTNGIVADATGDGLAKLADFNVWRTEFKKK